MLGIGKWVWCLVIGGLIVVWIAVGIKNLGWINKIAMAALFILSIVLCVVVFRGGTPVTAPDDSLSFGAAVELAVAMPLSWLPLISDYTREAEKPFAATLSSTLTYGVVSCWMYVIGMGAAIFTGEGDIALIMVKAGLGVAALLILILSTVTTTFLDAYSAGISAESLSKKINGKYAALIVTVIGTVCAICFPMDDITNFLYLIGSVFAPMIAIQITDFFLLRRGGASGRLDVCNAVVWVLGFVLYRVLMTVDIPVGNTLPDMAGTMLLCLIAFGFIDYSLVLMHVSRTYTHLASGLAQTSALVSSGSLPLLYAGAMLVDAVAALVFGLLYDKKGVQALVWSTALSAPFAVFVFACHSVGALLVGIALWGVGMGAQESILKAAVTQMVPKASRATGYGMFECAFGVFWFLGSWLLGVLYDVSIPAMVAVSAAAQLAAIPLYLRSAKLYRDGLKGENA